MRCAAKSFHTIDLDIVLATIVYVIGLKDHISDLIFPMNFE